MTRSVAYLVSEYPAMSHAFIAQEIASLEGLGWQVQPFSVRTVSSGNQPAATSRAEQTTITLMNRPVSLIRSTVSMGVRNCRACLRGLRDVLQHDGAGSGRSVSATVRRIAYFMQACKLLTQMQRLSLRHVHVHFANNASEVARLATRMSGGMRSGPITFSLTLHSLAMHGLDGTASQDWPYKNAQAWGDLKTKLSQATFVACISSFTRKRLIDIADEVDAPKLHVVHMGVDTSRYRYRSRLPVASPADGGLRVGFVGRLAPEKSPGAVLQAVALVRNQLPSIQLNVVGRGELLPDLKALAEELRIDDITEFRGALPQTDLPRFYADIDVLCLPSVVEGVPVVLMEAMAVGCQVVASDVAGVPELVQDGVTGFLVPPSDAERIAQVLMQIARETLQGEDRRLAARRHVERDYDSRTVVQPLSRLLELCVPMQSRAQQDADAQGTARARLTRWRAR